MKFMKRYFIKLSFKGTNYEGWQSQPGKVTVQGEVKKALELILGEKICLVGAGRTDSGVHALNYMAHLDSESLENKSVSDIIHKLNRFLSKDIVIQDIIPVDKNAHARFDAISRTYHYVIATSKNPFLDDYSLYHPQILDVSAMNRACEILLINKDFASFSKLHSDNKTTICDIREAEWRQINGDILVFRITADRFLRNMVRAITGTMLEIGSGKIHFNEMQGIIDKKDRSAAGLSVKAKGLFLTDIRYQNLDVPKNSYQLFNDSLFF
jgi:tRNA pseudouridine38-40 synthase